MSGSEDSNWKCGDTAKGLSASALVRKQSLRNIKPRSYSSLLKSESEGEEEEKTARSAIKPNVAAVSKQGS